MPTVRHPIVGKVSYSNLGGGRLRLLTKLDVRTAFVPQLKGVPTYGGRFSGRVPFYGPAIPQFLAAWAAVEKLGYLNQVIFWAGSWVPRLKRGGSTPSEHTFACAFDINPDQNGFRQPPARKGQKGYLGDVARIFKRFGFTHGGDWKSPDAMHIQIARIMSAAEIEQVNRELGVTGKPQEPAPQPTPQAKPGEKPKLVLDGLEPMDVVMVGDRPFAPVRDVLATQGVTIKAWRDDIEESKRFYIRTK